ncbi:hypothetical protein AAFP30_20680 [Gordonia sp. CPCC 205515]|uniref:hypothetical protein n=1 Tax=Gordonia sp. CPCC 205515 TaxID=3140791 RepID=UPI003AF351BA
MADRGIGSRDTGNAPGERQRFKKLAQAALNADVTVDQVQGILVDLGGVLEDMDKTITGLDGGIDNLNGTLARMSGTLDQVDATVGAMGEVVDRLERVVSRVEALVGIGEAALRPLGALESAGRSVAARLGLHV